MSTSIAKSITFESFVSLWFMPVNILLTFVIGSALGWLLFIITKPPQHLKGLVIGTCAAGNLGSLFLIIVPAECKEKSSPFGDPDVCSKYGMAYASLSMAIGAILLWSYVYNLMRVFSDHSQDTVDNETTTVQENLTPMPLPLSTSSTEVKGKMKRTLEERKRVQVEAQHADVRRKTLQTATGETISYKHLIIATGARALKLEEFGVSGSDAENVCYLTDR